jgi:hypothetical protein
MPPVHETNVLMQLGPYRATFDKTFAPLLGKNAQLVLEDPAAVPIGHHVISYPHARGAVVVTVGFARREQRHAHGETPKYVELIAEPPRSSEHVAKALAALGAWIHATDRPIDVRFKAYEPVRVRVPIYEVEHFLLMPAGDATLPSGEHITLLRVIPAAPDEYALIKMRGDGAARAWWHRHRADSSLAKRWAPVLRHDR